jgi:hypothetical protein
MGWLSRRVGLMEPKRSRWLFEVCRSLPSESMGRAAQQQTGKKYQPIGVSSSRHEEPKSSSSLLYGNPG